MAKENLNIIPSVTVHKLLEAYPELEDVLIAIAPPFKKLKNPFLRRSVAKVATIKHISSVGKVPLVELVNTLRKAVGQTVISVSCEDEEYFQAKPAWFSAEKISVSIDEDRLEDKDKMTLTVILKEAKNIEKGEIIELVTTFLPAPGIDIMKSKGYSVWTTRGEGISIRTYFLKS